MNALKCSRQSPSTIDPQPQTPNPQPSTLNLEQAALQLGKGRDGALSCFFLRVHVHTQELSQLDNIRDAAKKEMADAKRRYNNRRNAKYAAKYSSDPASASLSLSPASGAAASLAAAPKKVLRGAWIQKDEPLDDWIHVLGRWD